MSAVRRFARIEIEGPSRRLFVEVDGDVGIALDAAPWMGGRSIDESFELGAEFFAGRGPSTKARLLAPVAPSKILGVGRNYRAHAKELANEVPVEPMLFFKPPSSLLDPGGKVELLPERISARIDHEAELGVVIGKRVRHASLAEANASIFGFTLVCDVTARDLQKKDGQWWRAKGSDGFCPVGPSIVTGLDPSDQLIRCTIGGVVKQSGHTGDMIFPVAEVIRHVSEVMTLEPGDLIATGTPEGVGPLTSGDRVEIEIAAIGVLAFDVTRAG